MKKILVATDFSPIADQAFLYAAHLAAHWQAKLILGHVMSPSPFLAHSPGDLIDQSLKDMRHQIEEHLQQVEEQLPAEIRSAITCDYEVREGLVLDQLEDMTDVLKVDLLVMGTHGKTGWREVLMGTHAAAMIGRLDVPLLLVPPKADYKSLQHVVYAIDYHDVPDEELSQLRQWMSAFDAKLTLLHVDQDEDEVAEDQLFALRNTVAAFDEVDTVSYAFIEGKDALLAINDWAEEADADLLIVKHRNQNFFQQLVHKSLSRELSQYTSLPLLVIQQ